jgi:hypothetical protein
MNRFLKNIFLCSLIFCCCLFKVAAQNEESPAETDTVIAGTDSSESQQVFTANFFTPKSEQTDPNNYQLRQVSAQVLDSLKKQDAFWYADSAFGTKKDQPGPETSNSTEGKPVFRRETSHWLSTQMLVIIMLIALGAIIYFLMRSNIVTAGRQTVSQDDDTEGLENIFEINFKKELDKALTEKNYRLAVRLMFLRQLKILSEKNIIQYKHEKTDLDYLVQIQASRYYKDFFRLTRNYEYVWYGKFELQPETFNVIKSDFENFDRSLN